MFKKLIRFFKGRSTMFATFFALIGTVLAFMRRLDMSYVALVTALQAYVVIHSGKEDYFKKVNNDVDNSHTTDQPS